MATKPISSSSQVLMQPMQKETWASSIKNKISNFFSSIFASRSDQFIDTDELEMRKVSEDCLKAAQMMAYDFSLDLLQHKKPKEQDCNAIEASIHEGLISLDDFDDFEKVIKDRIKAVKTIATNVKIDLVHGAEPKKEDLNALKIASDTGLIKDKGELRDTYNLIQKKVAEHNRMKERLADPKAKFEPRGSEAHWKQMQEKLAEHDRLFKRELYGLPESYYTD